MPPRAICGNAPIPPGAIAACGRCAESCRKMHICLRSARKPREPFSASPVYPPSGEARTLNRCGATNSDSYSVFANGAVYSVSRISRSKFRAFSHNVQGASRLRTAPPLRASRFCVNTAARHPRDPAYRAGRGSRMSGPRRALCSRSRRTRSAAFSHADSAQRAIGAFPRIAHRELCA